MGPGIVAQVMLEYSRDRTGSWGKLVHQLVCERPLEEREEQELEGLEGMEGQEGMDGPARREKRLLRRYEKWRDWFERQEHHEAVGGSTPSYLKNVATWS